MSQRIFSTTKYKVLTGWDHPLSYFFLVVENAKDEAIVFSNLARRTRPGMALHEIHATLEKLGIVPPPTLFTDLVSDSLNNSALRHEYLLHGESKT